MLKRIKITLYVILILVIAAVVWLMFGNTNLRTEVPTDKNTEILTGNNIIDLEEPEPTVDIDSSTFEEDVMKDLEGFFDNSNGYENVQGEYGFINAGEE